MEEHHNIASPVNDRVSIRVNARGQIVSLRHVPFGDDFIRTNRPTGWTLITTLGEWTEHAVFDKDNVGEIAESEDEVRVRFDTLVGMQGARLDIVLTLIFRLTARDEIEATATIENRSGETINEFWFPFVSGFRQLKNGGALTMPMQLGRLITDPERNLPRKRYGWFGFAPGGSFYAPRGFRSHYPVTYPGTASMPWMDYFNDRYGVYIASHAEDFHNTALLARGRDDDEGFQLGLARYPFIKPGATWRSPVSIIRPHEGDWHAGADRYRTFTRTRPKPTRAPAWIANAAGVHQVSMKHQNKHVLRTYDELVALFRADRAAGLDLPLLVFSWTRFGHDANYPHYEPDPLMGGADGLKRAIQTIRAEGGHVMLYTQGRLIDMASTYYRNGPGARIAVKNREGVPYYEEWSWFEEGTVYPNKLFALMCPFTSEWREQLWSQITMVRSLGASGILFDQIGATSAMLCFDPEHGHAAPDEAYGAKAPLLEDLQARIETIDPDFAIMGEHICDAFLPHLDLTHGVSVFPDPSDPPHDQVHISLYRYTHPSHRVTTRAARTKAEFSDALMHGLLFEIPDQGNPGRSMPADVWEHVARIAQLRQRLERFFARGEFSDREGFAFDHPSLLARSHRSEDGSERAVVFRNRTDAPVDAEVTIDRAVDAIEVFTPEQPAPVTRSLPRNTPVPVRVEAQSVAVVVARQ